MEKILLVEDEARIRNIVLDYFTAHGLSCDLARNGEEALDILRDNDYDAILLDILMPGLDGFAVCQSVRKKSNVPILFLTALGSEEDTLKGYALGCDDYVVKPFSLAILLAKTQALIRRRNGGNHARHESKIVFGRAGRSEDIAQRVRPALVPHAQSGSCAQP